MARDYRNYSEPPQRPTTYEGILQDIAILKTTDLHQARQIEDTNKRIDAILVRLQARFEERDGEHKKKEIGMETLMGNMEARFLEREKVRAKLSNKTLSIIIAAILAALGSIGAIIATLFGGKH